ncbi:unnamed protein product [Paramecium sonneborni]|uniref:Uncharacterized protein n=1 Tax=Paramecium sonneborni TaxID=65129 RepID=A0A8S1P2K9_9CILI|nr:unnamed protein product [Paramecium sonneborni]
MKDRIRSLNLFINLIKILKRRRTKLKINFRIIIFLQKKSYIDKNCFDGEGVDEQIEQIENKLKNVEIKSKKYQIDTLPLNQ